MTKAEYIKRYGEEAYKKKLERIKAYKQANREKYAEQKRVYYEVNRERLAEYWKQYHNTKNGRAIKLLSDYKRNDKKYNRGECTLTAEWIIENIFSGQVCHWCNESEWTKLGCDRINNDLPHTPENVVCSCEDCNVKRGRMTYDEYRRLLNTKIA